MSARVVLVGELNPYGGDPRHALYDEPERASGGRLRRLVLGLPRRLYLDPELIERGNLCTGRWSAPAARARAARVVEERPESVIVMLGRRVAAAFGRESMDAATRDGRFVAIPHPSGLNRAWNDRTLVPRVRALLDEVAPEIPWGSLDREL